MRRTTTAAVALAVAGTGLVGTAGTAGAAPAATSCSARWGSGLKTVPDSTGKPLKNIRTGRNTCYDRMVFDVTGPAGRTGYHVSYVTKFRQDGSGTPIPVAGGAVLQVVVNAPSYDPATAKPVYPGRAGKPLPGVDVKGYRTFKDTKFGASYEGQTQVGVGVRARLPFRVLQSGDKLIVDVAHTW
ncbi:hypothetical protein [Streptomyces sp. NPDC050504]|uniref:AMIN-like domain-containing (lipo)protein n=1 Tax=Streptomyces sp. NPDC050504 TaxID=3365618 RepID=UPI0037AAB583